MKVFVIGDICGVSSVLQSYLKKLGIETEIHLRSEWDKYGHSLGHHSELEAHLFLANCLLKARKFDLIHVHDSDVYLRWIRLAYPDKPIVLHYHGTLIRGKWGAPEKKRLYGFADRILVSTIDLLEGAPSQASLMLNPVDTNLFHSYDSKFRAALYFARQNALNEAEMISKNHRLPLEVVEQPIQHKDMPQLLNQYSHYIDVKRDLSGKLLGQKDSTGSLTALEALACGLIVLGMNYSRYGLPSEHLPENVAEILAKIYKEALK